MSFFIMWYLSKRTSAVLAILINIRRQKIAADISKFGGSSGAIFCHYKLTLWQRTDYFIFSILLILLIKSVWYSRKPCFTLLVLTLLHYGRCSKIVCMFVLKVYTWSISELSMYFKISHKNKSVHKRIALELLCSYLEELIELRRQWSIISDIKIRRRQKIAADNLIFGSIIGGNCLLPQKIARTAS
jgi:hypothetical protein